MGHPQTMMAKLIMANNEWFIMAVGERVGRHDAGETSKVYKNKWQIDGWAE